jgi:hypothetical protein
MNFTSMKIVSVIFISLVLFVACKNDKEENAGIGPDSILDPVDISNKKGTAPDTANFTTVEWIDTLQDFGEIKQGEVVNLIFRFKNTGDKPLIVESTHAGCGCTVPDHSKEPVMPGKEGFIKASFNSKNQFGEVHKNVSAIMNTKPFQDHMLLFKGKVITNN